MGSAAAAWKHLPCGASCGVSVGCVWNAKLDTGEFPAHRRHLRLSGGVAQHAGDQRCGNSARVRAYLPDRLRPFDGRNGAVYLFAHRSRAAAFHQRSAPKQGPPASKWICRAPKPPDQHPKLKIEKLRRTLYGLRSERRRGYWSRWSLNSTSRMRPQPKTNWQPRKRGLGRKPCSRFSASGRRANRSSTICRASASS